MLSAQGLTDAQLVAVAHAMGIYRWRSRVELVALVEAWPRLPTFAGMRETRKTTIGGVEYAVRQVGAKTGRQVLLRVARALPAVFGMGSFTVADLSPDDLDYVCDALLAEATVAQVDPLNPGKPPVVLPLMRDFDDRFAGRYEDLLELLAFAWELNRFNEVFRAVVGRIAQAGAPATSASPPAATGTSTVP